VLLSTMETGIHSACEGRATYHGFMRIAVLCAGSGCVQHAKRVLVISGTAGSTRVNSAATFVVAG
jgi:hypothetical protein